MAEPSVFNRRSSISKLLCIVGQTASGKSGLAMQVARKHNGEIIAADSRTVYEGLDIGTAKPSKQDMVEVPHHLVDVVSYENAFTVADFQSYATKVINDIKERGHLPILVGGSGLYVNSIIYDYQLGGEADLDLRIGLEALTIQGLQNRIKAQGLKMPENAQNKRYLVRVLERGDAPTNNTLRPDVLLVGLRLGKTELEKRVRARLTSMLEAGLIDEVKKAHDTYPPESEALKGNIYRVLLPYTNNEKSLEECLEESVRSDLRLARRQIAWFKRNKDITWFNEANEAYSFIESNL